MQIGVIEGATRVIGKSQGYIGLPLRDELVNCTVGGEGTSRMVSAWQPTPAELADLMAGASVHLGVIGEHHPPVMLSTGPRPDGSESASCRLDLAMLTFTGQLKTWLEEGGDARLQKFAPLQAWGNVLAIMSDRALWSAPPTGPDREPMG